MNEAREVKIVGLLKAPSNQMGRMRNWVCLIAMKKIEN